MKKLVVLMLLTGATTLTPAYASDAPLKVNFIDVGQGDSILIDYGEVDILIDAGGKAQGQKVVDYLKSHEVDDLELVIGTHNHEDHIGGLPKVFETFPVKRYIDSGVPSKSKIYEKLVQAVEAEGCPFSGDENEIIQYGDLTVEVIDTGDIFADTNDTSVVALITYGSNKMLFAGDASYRVDSFLAPIGHVNLYKAEHHGSRTGNSYSLLSALTPDLSVVSYGLGNRYGHPHTEAIESMLQFSSKTMETAGRSIEIPFSLTGMESVLSN